MDVDDEEFGSPMPPSAEMDDINSNVNANHASASFVGDSTAVTHQTPSSTSGGTNEKELLRADVANGLISSSTPTALRSSAFAAGVGDRDDTKSFADKLNGFYSDADTKFTSREPQLHRSSNAGVHGLKFDCDVDGKLTNNFVTDKHRLDFFHAKIGSDSDRQPWSESRPAVSNDARNSISGLRRENVSSDTTTSILSSKPLSSSAASAAAASLYHHSDSLFLSRRTSESAACQQCNFVDPSLSFASALAKVSMLNQLSTSGEDSGLGGGGVGSHEMAEIMHNYVRALHTSPAFQQFIQFRSATATGTAAAGGASPGSAMMLGDSQDTPLNGKNFSQHAIPLESASSVSSLSAATAGGVSSKSLSPRFLHESGLSYHLFNQWSESEQVLYVEFLLDQMQHSAQSRVNLYLRPKLQRDFISLLPKLGMQHIAEAILEKLDDCELLCAEKVSPEWYRAIADGMQWKKLIERNVIRDTMWRGLGERRGWIRHLFKRLAAQYSAQMSPILSNDYFRALYPDILKDIKRLEDNWRSGKHNLQRINCRSENSKGVYCLQYDEDKIVSGLRDNTIKIWDKKTLQLRNTLKGHNGSVLCLQYDDKIIISGSSDATVRVWDVNTGEQLAHLLHHCEAVLHLRFGFGIMVTCSKDRSIAVWDMTSSRDISFRRNLVGHRAAVNVVDFDEKYIVSASGDRSIKVWNTQTCELVRNLQGHRRGIACLQYRDKLVVSGSSDYTIRIWDIELGHCLRVLEGHEELVRCIRFDNKRIVSGAYDGKIKVWDLEASLDVRRSAASLCIQTLVEHTGRVFRLQFDEFQIVSSSHDDTILIWDFYNGRLLTGGGGSVAASQQPLGSVGGAPPDAGDNNNAGRSNNNAGGPPGSRSPHNHYQFNVNAGGDGGGDSGGGAYPPPADDKGIDDADSSRFVVKPIAPGDAEMSDAVMPPTQYQQSMPSNSAALNSVSQMMLPLQQQAVVAGGVGGRGTNNSSSASSSSSSTPLSAAVPYFALHADNIVISSHSSNDAVAGDDAGNAEHSYCAKPILPDGAVTCRSILSGTSEIMSFNHGNSCIGGNMENIQPKLSQLELATAQALNAARKPTAIEQLEQFQLTTSSMTAAGASSSSAVSSRLLSHTGGHVSSPALLESTTAKNIAGHFYMLPTDKTSSVANNTNGRSDRPDDLAQQTFRVQSTANTDNNFNAPVPSSDIISTGRVVAVGTALQLRSTRPQFSAPPSGSLSNSKDQAALTMAATDTPVGIGGGDHGLYVRHKAKRSVAAVPKYYYHEGAPPTSRRSGGGGADNAKVVLQQLPATLQAMSKSLIPAFPVAPGVTTSTVASSTVSDTNRPVSEADSSTHSTMSEVTSEFDGGAPSRLTTNDAV